jgi:hypothetical protein
MMIIKFKTTVLCIAQSSYKSEHLWDRVGGELFCNLLFFVVLGYEFWILFLLDTCSTTRATLPAENWFLLQKDLPSLGSHFA